MRLGDPVKALSDERLFALEEKDDAPVMLQLLRSKVDLRRRLKELGGVVFAHEEVSKAREIEESSVRAWIDPLLRDSCTVPPLCR